MAVFYAQYQMPHIYNFPVTNTEWSSVVNTVEIPNIYTSPILHFPVSIITLPHIIPPICPYTAPLVITEPLVPTLIPGKVSNNTTPVIYDDLYNQNYRPTTNCTHESISPVTDADEVQYTNDDISEEIVDEVITESTDSGVADPVELYLQLPKKLFPSARMLSIDANPIIDEFCKVEDINENVSWLLDLEFGVPRTPVRRTIAVYDVKYNSVHCKNTPNAIHPGFEKCNKDFKRILLFYYDCIVSNWYNGYMVLKYDKSVENFQSWLLVPMQIFGMCWS